MINNEFFKPTALYKEFRILDLIRNSPNITQREISSMVGISVSMVNDYFDIYEKNGYLIRDYQSKKNVSYKITKAGIERMKYLNIGFLNASQNIYSYAKHNIKAFLNQIIEKGFKNILLYGAGEVAEILLTTIRNDSNIPLNVVGVIDDDESKQEHKLVNYDIHSNNEIKKISHDGILIASYTHSKKIFDKLINLGYSKEKIINFFDI